MNQFYFRIFLCMLFYGSIQISNAQYPAGSPVARYGKLKVNGKNLQSECQTGATDYVQLRGMSTHGLQWFQPCMNTASLDALAIDWQVDVLRLAMYVNETGYSTNPAKWKAYLDDLVFECGKRGIYCIIDWHVTVPGDPNADITIATDFWNYMSKQHAGKKHVLYEICNEPSGVSWSTVKSFATKIIPVIRANDPSTIVIVGTPDYSSRPDQAANDPLTYSNIMYSLHFYAGNSAHNAYMNYGKAALDKNQAVFVTEFGTTGSDGAGTPNTGSTNTWMQWMATNHVSWCNWNFSDDAQSSAALVVGSCAAGTYNNTKPAGSNGAGDYIKTQIKGSAKTVICTSNIVPPAVSITSPTNNKTYLTPSDVTLTASATTATGTITKVDFIYGTTLIGSSTTAPYSFTWTNVPRGTYLVKAVATTSQGIVGTSNAVNVFVNLPEAPYGGKATPIPGIVEGENYDEGGNYTSYYDSDLGNAGLKYRTDDVDVEAVTSASGGFSIGFLTPGEYLKYTVNVAATAKYSVTVSTASMTTGGKMHLVLDDKDELTGPITTPVTATWTTWMPVTVQNLVLTAGVHILKVVFDTGGFNYDKAEFKQTGMITGTFSPDDFHYVPVNIFPNPSNSSFTLRINEEIRSLSVVNILGEQVLSKENVSAGQNMDLGGNLEAGTYFLHVQDANGKSEVHKLMKIK